jgi:glycosyltransferase involved in cell wall biosynthesis
VNICVIGKHPQRPALSDNRLDAPLWDHYAKNFEKVFLIYESADGSSHHTGEDNVELFLLGGHGLVWDVAFPLRAMWRVWRLNRQWGVDVISASESFGGGLAGTMAKLLLGIPFVFQIQGQSLSLPASNSTPIRRLLTRQVTRLAGLAANRVRCVSGEIMAAAEDAGIAKDKLVYLSYRLRLDVFDRERVADAASEIRRGFGFSHDDVVIAYLGALLRDKGVYDALGALKLLAETDEHVRLMLVGDGPERAGLAEEAASAGLGERVTFAGYIPNDRVPGYLAASDIFLFPSRHEGAPRAVGEAMAMSLPVVASAVGGIPEVIKDGETGILLRTADADEIASVVGRLLGDPTLRTRLGSRARAEVEATVSFAVQADAMVDLHTGVVSGKDGLS